jgi:hypothetical protein
MLQFVLDSAHFPLQYLQTLTDFSGHSSNGNSVGGKESDSMAVASNSFFSLTEEDDLIGASPQHSPVKENELSRGTSPGANFLHIFPVLFSVLFFAHFLHIISVLFIREKFQKIKATNHRTLSD